MPPAEVITLRPVALDDWSAIHEWASTDEVCQYLSWGPNSPDDTMRFVHEALGAWTAVPQRRYVWAATSADGVVGLGELDVILPRQRRAQIGLAVPAQHWGRGIGTDIAAQLLRFAIDELGLHRIVATCDSRNVRAAAVIRKVGMTHEGRLRQVAELRDGYRDLDVFSLLESETDHLPGRV